MTNDEHSFQVEDEHFYAFAHYVSRTRWISIWHQVMQILDARPQSVLEIGVGPGVLGAVLQGLGIHHESVDIDDRLRPDHVASARHLPLLDSSFDVVAGFQVLEHLPYDDFVPALKEMARVSRGPLAISLPDARKLWPYSIYVPRIGDVRFHLPHPRYYWPRKNVFDGRHYWEINKRGYPLERILGDIASAGLRVDHTHRVFENPYWRFFGLSER